MSKPNPIFRQAALDRLASPEQLDELMQVATPRSGWALGACCALVLVAVLWSIWGLIPSKVSGPGILIRQGGVFVTTARSDGNVQEILTGLNEHVTNGQLLARLQLPESELRIRHSQLARERLRQELNNLDLFHQQEMEKEREQQIQQTQTYEAMVRDYQDQITALQERVASFRELLQGDSPPISKLQLLEAQDNLSAAQHELARTRIQMKQILLNELQAAQRRHQQQAEKKAQLLQAEEQLELLTRLHHLDSEILSPFDGAVLEIMVKPGQRITPNSPILSLQRAGGKLEARLFLPPAEGKQVSSGMSVAVAPVSAKKEVFGLMLGQVTQVSPFPVRPESMLRILENPALVSQFSQQGAPIEVVVELAQTNTVSGYRWTSGRGPNLVISSGTLCEGIVTVTNQRPIQLVLPLLRESMNW